MFPITEAELEARRALGHGDMWCYVAPADVAAATVAAVALDTDFDTFFLGAPNTLCEQPTLERLRARWGYLPELRRPEFYADDPIAGLYDSSKAGKSWVCADARLARAADAGISGLNDRPSDGISTVMPASVTCVAARRQVVDARPSSA